MHKLTGFNAVQNNTSLKPVRLTVNPYFRFNAVQNNTSLKPSASVLIVVKGFNAVQNNTSLKHTFTENRFS